MENDKVMAIRAQPAPFCYLCGSAGVLLHEGLTDCFLDSGQKWNIKKCSNSSCGLGWVDPLPKEEDIHKAYESYYTHSDPSPSYNSLVGRIYKYLRAGYLSRGYGYFKDLVHWWQKLAGLIIYLHPGRRAVIDSQIMEVPAGVGRLLDIGCGNGRKLELLGELGWDTHGVEQDPGAVENCRSKNLNVRCGTLLEQQYEAGYYDVVTMSHVIEHLHDPRETLKEVRRILKPGGQLVMTAPNIAGLGARYFGKAWLGWDPPRHIHNFSRSTITALAVSCELSVLNVKTTISDAHFGYMGSNDIRNRRKVRVMRWPKSEKLAGLTYQMIMWAWLKFNDDIGDELRISARKSEG